MSHLVHVVGAGVGVCADAVLRHDGVAVVGAGAAPAGDAEHAADAEGGGTGAAGLAAQTGALAGSVAGAVIPTTITGNTFLSWFVVYFLWD